MSENNNINQKLLRKLLSRHQGFRTYCTSTNSEEYDDLELLVESGLVEKFQNSEDKFAGNFFSYKITQEGRQYLLDLVNDAFKENFI